MKEALRLRFWCDHCKKGGCSRHHMAIHERGCTLNPRRVCGHCSELGLDPEPLEVLVAFVTLEATWEPGEKDKNDRGFLADEHVKELRELADRCPVCMLAALRQSKCFASREVFDMKKELKGLRAESDTGV